MTTCPFARRALHDRVVDRHGLELLVGVLEEARRRDRRLDELDEPGVALERGSGSPGDATGTSPRSRRPPVSSDELGSARAGFGFSSKAWSG